MQYGWKIIRSKQRRIIESNINEEKINDIINNDLENNLWYTSNNYINKSNNLNVDEKDPFITDNFLNYNSTENDIVDLLYIDSNQ